MTNRVLPKRAPAALAGACLITLSLSSGLARADDKADCIAAFDAGQKLRADGKLTQAIAQFAVCAREVCPPSLQKECVEQADASAELRPTVVLSATDSRDAAILDATVTVDGAVVATVLDGKAIPMDPGLHTFRFDRAGDTPVERTIAIKEGQKGQLVAVQLLPSLTAPPLKSEPFPPSPAPPKRLSTLRWIGVATGAAGIVGISLGSAYGLMAIQKWSDAKSQCGASCEPGSAAYATRSAGETDATVSTVAFVAGAAALATGAILYFLVPSLQLRGSAALTPTPGGATLWGTF